MERIAPSARLEAQIEELLGDELAANGEKLAELGRLGARLVLQRAVEDDSSSNLSRSRLRAADLAASWRSVLRDKTPLASNRDTVSGPRLASGNVAPADLLSEFAYLEEVHIVAHQLVDPPQGGLVARMTTPPCAYDDALSSHQPFSSERALSACGRSRRPGDPRSGCRLVGPG